MYVVNILPTPTVYVGEYFYQHICELIAYSIKNEGLLDYRKMKLPMINTFFILAKALSDSWSLENPCGSLKGSNPPGMEKGK